MIVQVLGAVLVLFVVGVALRSLWVRAGLSARQTVLSVAAAALVVAVIVLAASGRLNWLVAAGAALLPLVRRIGSLVRYAPFLASVFPGLRARLNRQRRSRPDPDPTQHSTTESAYFRMTLHLGTGHMDGEVKLGPQRGRFLSELRLAELLGLFGEIRDRDSERLLEAYLDHHYPEWRTARSRHSASNGSELTRAEALEALGLQEGASRDEIIAAHRRLIQRLHPDRGGSGYLAALLNRAKDLLLAD
jgi:hypothetical protein